jgi:tRNA(Ile)-lysidine synthase
MARTRTLGPAVTLIRPLLGFRRTQLLKYLTELGQPYRHDSSNDDLRFTRNLIRRRLIPQLEEQLNPGVVDALVRLGQLAGEVDQVVAHLVEDLATRCVAAGEPAGVEIDTAALAREPRYVVRQLLLTVWERQGWPMQAMGFAQWERLAEMALSEAGGRSVACRRITLPGNVDAVLDAERLRLVRQRPQAQTDAQTSE